MESDDNVVKASDMIEAAFTNIEHQRIEKSNSILRYWRIVVESIKSNARNGSNIGKNLASHSRVIDLKNGTLLVEADHPAWIQTLKIYQKYIITGLNHKIDNIDISSIVFRLKGTDFCLRSEKIEEDTKKLNEKILDRLNREQMEFEKFNVTKEEKSKDKEIPEDLRKILERLKKDMLT